MHNYLMSLGMPEPKYDVTVYMYEDRGKLLEAFEGETGGSSERIGRRFDEIGYVPVYYSVFIDAGSGWYSRSDSRNQMETVAGWLYEHRAHNRLAVYPVWLLVGSEKLHIYMSLSKAGLLSYESERKGPQGSVELGMNIDKALSALETLHGFGFPPFVDLALAGSVGDPRLNDVRGEIEYSLLAAEFLASHVGLAALMRYYEHVRIGTTWKDIFQTVFGMSVEEFYDLFDAHRMAGFPSLAIPAPSPSPPTAPRYSIVNRDHEYGYAIDLPDDWVEEEGYIASAPGGEMFIRDIDLPAGTTLQQYAESVRDNLRHDWWPSASMFEITSFGKRTSGGRELYSVEYRVQEDPMYCALDVIEVIGVGTSLPGLRQGFRVRHQLCEEEARHWQRQGLDRTRRETLDSFRIITRPSTYYKQFIDVEGITVKANDTVEAVSMYNTADVIKVMMRSLREDIRECLISAGAGLAIAPHGEYITTLPEFPPENGKYDRFVALGAVKGQPISGVPERAAVAGPYVVVHEFGHAVQNLCFTEDEHDEWNRFYEEARQGNLFPGTYGMTNPDEFFAQFSVSYFQQSYETQEQWFRERLTKQQFSEDLPEIFGFLAKIYESYQVEPYVAPTPVATFTPTPIARSVSPDRAVLVTLYNATDGANWSNNSNWLSDTPIGQWHGVTINDEGQVTTLTLVENRLSGELPSDLGSLAKLESLYLWSNRLEGEIPPEMGRLSNLTEMAIQDNQLTGEIPSELGNLSNLRSLHLWGNRLSGEIPSELGGLLNLGSLWLGGNPLTGCIPQVLRDVPDNDLAGLGLPSC